MKAMMVPNKKLYLRRAFSGEYRTIVEQETVDGRHPETPGNTALSIETLKNNYAEVLDTSVSLVLNDHRINAMCQIYGLLYHPYIGLIRKTILLYIYQ